MFRHVLLILSSACLLLTGSIGRADSLQFGFGRADITPDKPLRLSGYGNRSEPSAGVDEALLVRAMAFRKGEQGSPLILVSADTIGVPGTLTKSIHERIAAAHDIPRSHFVLTCTHSHTAPHIGTALTNLFATPLTDEQRSDLDEYADTFADQVVAAVAEAIRDLKPGRLFVGQGEATFAVNRRVLRDGVWTGFGINPDGPVDHSLPIIRITDETGKTLRGLIFNYACHCTTFDSDYNRVNGDWAGYAAQYLEQRYPGVTAVCTIGCGADANPERDRARAMQIAMAQGREVADEVSRVIEGPLSEITSSPQASFGYAGLPVDRPTREELQERLKDSSPQVRQHAENMLATWRRMGRLPETYPMPIQVFRFGDQFSMVFLGGEVCVDYAFRIRRELSAHLHLPQEEGAEDDPDARSPVWVTAYANDVFGYVAPERMQAEGGYEVDFSMIFYNQPGRWSSGTEEVIMRRVHEMHESTGEIGPLPPEQCLKLFSVPEGFTVDLVAAEPLIQDPVNFSLGADGRLWVVEMGDYPNGNPGIQPTEAASFREPWVGRPGGKIKLLTDSDSDGRYDEVTTFLNDIAMPTGVFPWRDGVVVTAAPEIFFARDTDGDGQADERRVLFTGFHEGNPQHRVNGFTFGLDGWLYVANSSNSRSIASALTGEQITTSGRDLRIHPDLGMAVPVSGTSQFGRGRDDFGSWFGNNNSQPLYHFVIEDRYLQRNPFVASPQPRVFLTEPSAAPPVYPTSRTLDRFNDLFALDRFTSACSPWIVSDRDLPDDINGAALICEPVHNLVSRVLLDPEGVTFRGHRHESEQTSEFLSSRDNWFRPVHIETGPDATIWVCDMYREVIEHPEWIPEAWQAKLDLYAGHDKGRIYRIRPIDRPGGPTPDLTGLASEALVDQIGSPNRWRRDTAQRLLLERNDVSVRPALEELVESAPQPEVRAQAIATLSGLSQLSPDVACGALSDSDPRVVATAIRFSEPSVDQADVLRQLLSLVNHEDVRVRYQLALSLGESNDSKVAGVLSALMTQGPDDPWIRAAVLSSAVPHAKSLLAGLLDDDHPIVLRNDLMQDLIATRLGNDVEGALTEVTAMISGARSANEIEDWQLSALAACVEVVRKRGKVWSDVAAVSRHGDRSVAEAAAPIFAFARLSVADEQAPIERRVAAIRLLGVEQETRESDLAQLGAFLSPRHPVAIQIASIRALAASHADGLVDQVLESWHRQTPGVRAEVLSTLLSRGQWTDQFIAAIDEGRIPPGDIDAATRARLQMHLRRTGREAGTLFAASDSSDRTSVVASYGGVGTLEGNAARGAELFKRVCSTCHKHSGIGNDLGPQLANLQDKSVGALLTALLDPNRAVEQKFRGYVIVTSDGRSLAGLIKSETAGSLTLVEPNGKEHVILRIDIEEMADTGKSFMPEGLEKDLSPQDIADIIAFVNKAG